MEDYVVADSGDLEAVVTFTSFGNVPTSVGLVFVILNEAGDEVYRVESEITVMTEEVLRWDYEGVELEEGEYVAVLETLYNVDVFDEFRQEFEIKEKVKVFFWLFVILMVLMFIGIGCVIYYMRRKR